MKTFSQTVDSSNPLTVPQGNFFILLDCSSTVDVEFYGDNNQPLEKAEDMLSGFNEFFDDSFMKVVVTSTISQTVKVGVGSNKAEYNRLSGSVNATISKPATLVDSADVSIPTATSTLIVAANSDRVNVTIQADPSNTGEIRIKASDDAVLKSTGLTAGQSMTIPVTDAVYCYHETGATEKVRVMEVRD